MRSRTMVAVVLVAVGINAISITSCTSDRDLATSGQTLEQSTATSTDRVGGTSPMENSASATTEEGTPVPGSTPTNGVARYAVGTFWRDFVDNKRGRTLKTLVHYPAVGSAGSEGSSPAEGEYPIVLMAHGYMLPAAGYERILTTLSAAGYITVSPAFPHTSTETGDGLRGDITNQPADLSFVLDEIVSLSAEPQSPLPNVAQPDRVGVIGHSDGGLTVSAFAFNRQFRDNRVAAAVVMTGGRALFPGSYFDGENLPPVLAVHGTADGNPYSGSQGLVRDAGAKGLPAYLLTIEEGAHIEPYMFDTAMPRLAQVIVNFMDAFMIGQQGALDRMRADGTMAGKLRLETG